jgi:STE24 endopeptidase
MVQHLADEAGVEVDTVQELEVSGRTSRVNAMVTGLGMTKQVVFYDTLLAQFSPAEVGVVVAHEMSHAIHNDVVTGWLFSAGVETVALLAAAWMLQGMVGAGPLRIPAPHAARGLALLVLFTTLFGQVTGTAGNPRLMFVGLKILW